MVGLYLAVTLRASSAVGVVMLVTSLCADIYCCLERRVFIVYFFFFQAEDGIRDKLVTGVQTCALPIWDHGGGVQDGVRATPEALGDVVGCGGRPADRGPSCHPFKRCVGPSAPVVPPSAEASRDGDSGTYRSEERRVGKECRSRWSPYH